MQLSLELLETRLRRAASGARDLRTCGTVQAGSRFRDEQLCLGNGPLEVASELRARVSRGTGGVLRLFPALERVVQREAIVASGDGVVGLLERLRRCCVFAGRVLFGAGRARSIDGTLRLVHLFMRRVRTGNCNEDDGKPRATGDPRGETHRIRV